MWHRKRIYKRPPVCESEVKPNKPALNLARQSRYKVSDIPPLKRSREKIRRRRVKDTATRRARGSLLPIEIFLKLNSLVNWEIKSFLKRQPVPGVGRDHSFRSHFRGCSIWLLFLLLFSRFVRALARFEVTVDDLHSSAISVFQHFFYFTTALLALLVYLTFLYLRLIEESSIYFILTGYKHSLLDKIEVQFCNLQVKQSYQSH